VPNINPEESIMSFLNEGAKKLSIFVTIISESHIFLFKTLVSKTSPDNTNWIVGLMFKLFNSSSIE